MNMPWHPLVIHFPIALTFILPVLTVAFAWLIKTNRMSSKAWLIVVAFQFSTTATGYLALETGDHDEESVEKVVAKPLIQRHEEAAEIFVGSTVVALVLGIAVFFLRYEYQFKVQLSVAALALLSCYLVYQTSRLGGELVYEHGAGEAFSKEMGSDETDGVLSAPNGTTSVSTRPHNESLNPDESDYDDSEAPEVDEEVKPED